VTGGWQALLKPKCCVVLLVDFRLESGVIPDIVNSDETPKEHLLAKQVCSVTLRCEGRQLLSGCGSEGSTRETNACCGRGLHKDGAESLSYRNRT
jgi:hypothetical protein